MPFHADEISGPEAPHGPQHEAGHRVGHQGRRSEGDDERDGEPEELQDGLIVGQRVREQQNDQEQGRGGENEKGHVARELTDAPPSLQHAIEEPQRGGSQEEGDQSRHVVAEGHGALAAWG